MAWEQSGAMVDVDLSWQRDLSVLGQGGAAGGAGSGAAGGGAAAGAVDDDEAFARQLQAQFDAEAAEQRARAEGARSVGPGAGGPEGPAPAPRLPGRYC